MNMAKIICCFLLLWGKNAIAHQSRYQNRFVFIVCSYNNQDWCIENLKSMFDQTYQNWRMIYINDASTDKTEELVKNYITERAMWDKVTYIKNSERCRQLQNQYRSIHSCNDDEIICIVDGDDRLAHPEVLTYLNTLYQNPNIWMTYGQLKKMIDTGLKQICFEVPADVVKNNTIRQHPWVLSHLRTFYAGLYKKIKQEDLMHQGNFLPACADVSTMIPMFEMAHGRYKFIEDILYLYNNANNLNVHKQDKNQLILSNIIRQKTPYQPLSAATSFVKKTTNKRIHQVPFQESLRYHEHNFDESYAIKCKRNPLFPTVLPHLENLYNLNRHLEAQEKPFIPKIIHQIWLGSPLPEKYKKWQNGWQKAHPDWTYILWTDKEINELNLYNREFYEKSENYGEKSDIARYEILYKFGGVYVDIDFECIQPLDHLHHTYEFYTCCLNIDLRGILANGIIGSRAKHPILKRCIETVKDGWAEVERIGKHDVLISTGPMLFEKAFYHETKKNSSRIIALPPTFFFPISQRTMWEPSFTGSKEEIKSLTPPETFGIHYWQCSWGKGAPEKSITTRQTCWTLLYEYLKETWLGWKLLSA